MNQNQYVPAGSYQLTSNTITITIEALCKNEKDAWVSSTLNYSFEEANTIGDISNDNGSLKTIPGNGSIPNSTNKWGIYVPAGSYQLNSKDIKITINAQCEQTGGNFVQSPALTYAAAIAVCISDLSNNEGTLQLNTATISSEGKAFIDSNGNRFIVRGVALSATGSTNLGIHDILADQHNDLMVDSIIPALSALNINCIRVYEINSNYSHKKTMNALEAAGIYVMVGLATPKFSINRMTGDYSYGVFLHAATVVDEFQAYRNTFCFSVGNEVEFPGEQATLLADNMTGSTTAEIVKAVIALQLKVAQAMKSFARDMKAHMVAKSYRAIPVGVAMQDGPQVNWTKNAAFPYQAGIVGTDIIAQYYGAGDATDRMDFIGINTYAYVSGLNQAPTAYNRLGNESKPLPIPVFLTETGAITNPRTWAVVPYMYTNDKLYHQLSGQVAFQMLEEGAGFGLYTVSGSPPNITLTINTGGGTSDLASQFLTASSLPVKAASATPVSPTKAPTTFGENPEVTVKWPTGLLPAYTVLPANTSITVKNYAQNEIQITQLGTIFGTVPAGSPTSPTSAKINVLDQTALSIQAQNGTSWDALCGVAASNVKAGITVNTNVKWGVYAACNVDLGAGDTISVNVDNYATEKINVVVAGDIVTTVAKSSDGKTPTTKAISLSAVGDLNLQTKTSNDQICRVSGLLVVDGVTIKNNLPWGEGCNLPIPTPGNIDVVVKNYNTTDKMQVVQKGFPIDSVAQAKSATEPTSKVVNLTIINDVFIQYEHPKGTFKTICKVPAASLKEWMTIGNDVAVNGETCCISYS